MLISHQKQFLNKTWTSLLKKKHFLQIWSMNFKVGLDKTNIWNTSSSGIYYSFWVFAAITIHDLSPLFTVIDCRSPFSYFYFLEIFFHCIKPFLSRPSARSFPRRFHSTAALTVFSSFLRITWPSQCIRWLLIKLLIGVNSSCNSQLNFLLHAPVLLS